MIFIFEPQIWEGRTLDSKESLIHGKYAYEDQNQ